jgi:hypothetical protein
VRIPELYRQQDFTLSLELFPPKNDVAEESLFRDTLPGLQRLGPSFFSVTYGAGGGTRNRTLRMASRIRQDFGVEAMALLTWTKPVVWASRTCWLCAATHQRARRNLPRSRAASAMPSTCCN